MNNDPGKSKAESQNLRVLLADDSAVSRQQLRDKLTHLPFVEVVGEAGNSHEALEAFFYKEPDAVIVSICLPEQGGFHVLRCLQRLAANCSVILTYRDSTQFIKDAAALLGAADTCPAGDGSFQLGTTLEGIWSKKQRQFLLKPPTKSG